MDTREGAGLLRARCSRAETVHRIIPNAMAVALFVAAAASAAWWVRAYQFADDDSGAAVRIARGCLELGECTGMGTFTSSFGLAHGAAWIRLTGLFLARGGGLTGLQLAVIAMLIAALALAYLTIRAVLPAPSAALALLLMVQPTLVTAQFSDLMNPVLLPLPLAVYYAGTVRHCVSGSILSAALASVGLAGALSASLSSAVMVPLHLALVGLFARRPLAAAGAAAATLVTAFALDSPGTARAIGALLASAPVLVALLAIGAALALPALRRRAGAAGTGLVRRTHAWRARVAAGEPRTRVRVGMILALVYLNTAVWAATLLLGPLDVPGPRFFAPGVFPLVFLAVDAADHLSARAFAGVAALGALGLLLLPFAPLAPIIGAAISTAASAAVFVATGVVIARRRRPRWLATSESPLTPCLTLVAAGLALAASCPDLLVVPRQRQQWPVAAAERVVTRVYADGLTFPQLLASLQGQSPFTIQSMIASLDPDLFHPTPPAVAPGWSLLALIVDPAVVADTADTLLSVPIDPARTALVVQAPSVLVRTGLRTCYADRCDATPEAPRCIERQYDRPVRHRRPYFPVDKDETPGPGQLASYQPQEGSYCVVFFVPVRTDGSGVAHLVRVFEPWPLRAQIRSVSGVDAEGTIPGPEVRIPNRHPASGMLEVTVTGPRLGPAADWLEEPPLIEVTEANEHLLEPFRNRRVSLH